MIFMTMLAVGLLLGFAGTGGSGFILGLLVALFGIPIHTALGTSITAMAFTALSGSVSHLREGNAILRTGVIIGLFGAAGSYGGTFISRIIDPDTLIWLTSGMLMLSAFLIWLRTKVSIPQNTTAVLEDQLRSAPRGGHQASDWNRPSFWLTVAATGLVTGGLSGMFGIGSTPFIQLALLVFFKLPLRQAVGTTMVIIMPTAAAASIGFWQAGFWDGWLLAQVTLGTMLGTFIGARYTSKAPRLLLRTAMIALPAIGAIVMLL